MALIRFENVGQYWSQDDIYSSTGLFSKSKDQKRIEGASLTLARQVASPNFGLTPIGATADFGLARKKGRSASVLNGLVLGNE